MTPHSTPTTTPTPTTAAIHDHSPVTTPSTTANPSNTLTTTPYEPTTRINSISNTPVTNAPEVTTRTTATTTTILTILTSTLSSPSTAQETTSKHSPAGTETSVHPNVVEKPSSFVELNLGMSWADFCPMEMMFRAEVVQILQRGKRQNGITADQIKLINNQDGQCMDMSMLDSDKIKVQLYLLNKTHHYDRNLTRDLAYILKSDFEAADTSIMSKLINVNFRDGQTLPTGPEVGHVGDEDEDDGEFFNDPGISVAISIAVIGGFCCVSLIVLQYLWRKRNRDVSNLSTKVTKNSRIVYTAKPNRSFSMTSTDSIQLYSVSNKSSRRSSGIFNLGLNLSDPLDPTHPLNVDQLAEFCSDSSRIHREYEKIPNRLPRLSVVPIGEEDKNRYANVLPLPHTRVKLLQDGVQSNHSSYINASYVTGPNNECQYYIATQAPIDKTTGDFWTMVWQQKTNTIVMMTQMEENGQSKSSEYWPELTGKGAAQRHGDFTVELKQKDVSQEYIVSRLELNNLRKIETRTIFHYWYTCWPSHGTPEPISLVKFVLDCRPKYESGKTPLVVHCSPGTGRTCTFIGLDLCMRQFESHRVVDVLKVVNDMRHERAGAIQNKEQYTLIYKAINDYAKIVISPGVSAASSATTLHALLPG